MNSPSEYPKIEAYVTAITLAGKERFGSNAVEVTAFALEARAHLIAIVNENLAVGMLEADAVDAAMQRFGKADAVGKRFVKSVLQARTKAARPTVIAVGRAVLAVAATCTLLKIVASLDSIGWHGNAMLAGISGLLMGCSIGSAGYLSGTWIFEVPVVRKILIQRLTRQIMSPESMEKYRKLAESGTLSLQRPTKSHGLFYGFPTFFFLLWLWMTTNDYAMLTNGSFAPHFVMSNFVFTHAEMLGQFVPMVAYFMWSIRKTDHEVDKAMKAAYARVSSDNIADRESNGV